MRVPPDKAGPGMADPDDIPVGSVAIAEDMPLVIESDSKVGAATDSGGTAAVSADNQATGGGRTGSSHGVVDMGNTESGVVEPSIGSIGNALDNPVTIRIYNRNGIFYDSVYYVNIGFINRYEVSEEFAGYLSKYISTI
jgi:hypothetical protein